MSAIVRATTGGWRPSAEASPATVANRQALDGCGRFGVRIARWVPTPSWLTRAPSGRSEIPESWWFSPWDLKGPVGCSSMCMHQRDTPMHPHPDQQAHREAGAFAATRGTRRRGALRRIVLFCGTCRCARPVRRSRRSIRPGRSGGLRTAAVLFGLQDETTEVRIVSHLGSSSVVRPRSET